ncbi:MAG: thiolase family protein [Steroidobacteraceae bacterium]
MPSTEIVIASARRTPLGAFQGALAALSAPQLGAAALKGALDAAGIAPAAVDEVILGCVLAAGLGQAPARQAAIAAGVPLATPATTLNKMCGSGLKAVMMAADQIRAGGAEIVLAGGFESMTRAPYLLPKARGGYRMGHGEIIDHMFFDGLQSPFDGKLMGCFADATAARYGLTREQQDAFAAESVRRAVRAQAQAFEVEIVPVTVKDRKAERIVTHDETPQTCDPSKIPTLRPAFSKDGTVTAASASSIADGAAAVVVMDARSARSHDVTPLARIVAYASHAQEPEWFTTAPVGAVRKVLGMLGWQPGDVDLYEINEAFAAVTLVAMRDLGLDHARVNVNGGACALGHPLGATGARILTTLLHALRARNGRRGIAALCIGGGEAVAVAVEMIG